MDKNKVVKFNSKYSLLVVLIFLMVALLFTFMIRNAGQALAAPDDYVYLEPIGLTGDDTNPGTPIAPVQTIDKALELVGNGSEHGGGVAILGGSVEFTSNYTLDGETITTAGANKISAADGYEGSLLLVKNSRLVIKDFYIKGASIDTVAITAVSGNVLLDSDVLVEGLIALDAGSTLSFLNVPTHSYKLASLPTQNGTVVVASRGLDLPLEKFSLGSAFAEDYEIYKNDDGDICIKEKPVLPPPPSSIYVDGKIYVSDDGDDTFTGAKLDQPVKTYARAVEIAIEQNAIQPNIINKLVLAGNLSVSSNQQWNSSDFPEGIYTGQFGSVTLIAGQQFTLNAKMYVSKGIGINANQGKVVIESDGYIEVQDIYSVGVVLGGVGATLAAPHVEEPIKVLDGGVGVAFNSDNYLSYDSIWPLTKINVISGKGTLLKSGITLTFTSSLVDSLVMHLDEDWKHGDFIAQKSDESIQLGDKLIIRDCGGNPLSIKEAKISRKPGYSKSYWVIWSEAIFLDTAAGDDTLSGLGVTCAVRTFEKAYELLDIYGLSKIVLIRTHDVQDNFEIDKAGIEFSGYDTTDLFTIFSSSGKLTLKNGAIRGSVRVYDEGSFIYAGGEVNYINVVGGTVTLTKNSKKPLRFSAYNATTAPIIEDDTLATQQFEVSVGPEMIGKTLVNTSTATYIKSVAVNEKIDIVKQDSKYVVTGSFIFVGGTSGIDTNDGLTTETSVQTFEKALQILKNDPTGDLHYYSIMVLGVVPINSNYNLDGKITNDAGGTSATWDVSIYFSPSLNDRIVLGSGVTFSTQNVVFTVCNDHITGNNSLVKMQGGVTGASFVMGENTVIKGFSSVVYMNGQNSFIMNGGKITETKYQFASISNGGSFIFNNGLIEDNTLVGYGNAVYLYGNSEFEMNGGEIRNNTGYGFFVITDSSAIYLNSGKIHSNNLITNNTESALATVVGSKIVISGTEINNNVVGELFRITNGSEFIMNAGVIDENICATMMAMHDVSVFNMNGGLFSNNTIIPNHRPFMSLSTGSITNFNGGEMSGNIVEQSGFIQFSSGKAYFNGTNFLNNMFRGYFMHIITGSEAIVTNGRFEGNSSTVGASIAFVADDAVGAIGSSFVIKGGIFKNNTGNSMFDASVGGTFTMEGGSIIENKCEYALITVNRGTAIIKGGYIASNEAFRVIGAHNGKLKLSGGEIINNRIRSGAYAPFTVVNVDGNQARVTVGGIKINGNIPTSDSQNSGTLHAFEVSQNTTKGALTFINMDGDIDGDIYLNNRDSNPDDVVIVLDGLFTRTDFKYKIDSYNQARGTVLVVPGKRVITDASQYIQNFDYIGSNAILAKNGVNVVISYIGGYIDGTKLTNGDGSAHSPFNSVEGLLAKLEPYSVYYMLDGITIDSDTLLTTDLEGINIIRYPGGLINNVYYAPFTDDMFTVNSGILTISGKINILGKDSPSALFNPKGHIVYVNGGSLKLTDSPELIYQDSGAIRLGGKSTFDANAYSNNLPVSIKLDEHVDGDTVVTNNTNTDYFALTDNAKTLEKAGLNLVLASKTLATYYVKSTGSDSGAGTKADPFATLQKALEVMGQREGTIYIMDTLPIDGPLTITSKAHIYIRKHTELGDDVMLSINSGVLTLSGRFNMDGEVLLNGGTIACDETFRVSTAITFNMTTPEIGKVYIDEVLDESFFDLHYAVKEQGYDILVKDGTERKDIELLRYAAGMYYVSQATGDDSNDGLTALTALKTLEAAYTKSTETGAIICMVDEYTIDDDIRFTETSFNSLSKNIQLRLGKKVIIQRYLGHIAPLFTIASHCDVRISNLLFTAEGKSGTTFNVDAGGFLFLNNVDIRECNNPDLSTTAVIINNGIMTLKKINLGFATNGVSISQNGILNIEQGVYVNGIIELAENKFLTLRAGAIYELSNKLIVRPVRVSDEYVEGTIIADTTALGEGKANANVIRFRLADSSKYVLKGEGNFIKLVDVPRHKVTFNYDGGTPDTLEYAYYVDGVGTLYDAKTYGNQIDVPIPSKEGCAFLGWYLDGGVTKVYDKLGNVITMITSDTTLYANWLAGPTTITFHTNGGSPVGSITQNYNTPVTKPVDPTKEGHAFRGWFIAEDFSGVEYVFNKMPSTDLDLFAKWEINKYTVTIVSSNVDYGNVKIKSIPNVPYGTQFRCGTSKTLVIHGVEIVAEVMRPTDQYTYTFTGWTSSSTVVNGNITITANFASTVNMYTITWKNDDSTVLSTSIVAYGDLPSYDGPAFSREGSDDRYIYRVEGWTPEITVVTGDKTYTATYGEFLKVITTDPAIDPDDTESVYGEGTSPDGFDKEAFLVISVIPIDTADKKIVIPNDKQTAQAYNIKVMIGDKEVHPGTVITVRMKIHPDLPKVEDGERYTIYIIEDNRIVEKEVIVDGDELVFDILSTGDFVIAKPADTYYSWFWLILLLLSIIIIQLIFIIIVIERRNKEKDDSYNQRRPNKSKSNKTTKVLA
ncbi:MAG TPA: InlB B-repeat-containing protein [Clostridia bacterium]|nr:InlB B-repeat-containing protein [Clostridia bacterium]